MNGAVGEGLEGVVAARTRLSGIDGEKGRLWLAGYPVEELAPKAGFEETVYLLWRVGFRTASSSAYSRDGCRAGPCPKAPGP